MSQEKQHLRPEHRRPRPTQYDLTATDRSAEKKKTRSRPPMFRRDGLIPNASQGVANFGATPADRLERHTQVGQRSPWGAVPPGHDAASRPGGGDRALPGVGAADDRDAQPRCRFGVPARASCRGVGEDGQNWCGGRPSLCTTLWMRGAGPSQRVGKEQIDGAHLEADYKVPKPNSQAKDGEVLERLWGLTVAVLKGRSGDVPYPK